MPQGPHGLQILGLTQGPGPSKVLGLKRNGQIKDHACGPALYSEVLAMSYASFASWHLTQGKTHSSASLSLTGGTYEERNLPSDI